jgi:antimicrobial peptide system SdpA family protein
VLLVASAGLAESPIAASFLPKVTLLSLAPQGWAFFTRDPREPQKLLRAVGRDATGKPALRSVAVGRVEDYFGIGRRSRAREVEIALLMEQLPPTKKWTACSGPLVECATSDARVPTVELHNRALVRSLCGEFVATEQEPVPWAWAQHRDQVNMPAKAIKLKVVCP